jgi:hypothetical protein
MTAYSHVGSGDIAETEVGKKKVGWNRADQKPFAVKVRAPVA